MRISAILSTLAVGSMLVSSLQADSPSETLVYDKPAPVGRPERYALPIGNGSLGAMLFGGAAEETVQINIDTLWNGDEEAVGSYQNLGFLRIKFDGVNEKSVTDYQRKLHIDSALHETVFNAGGVRHRREAFSSAPDSVMVLYYGFDKPLSGSVSLEDDFSFMLKHPPYAGAKKVDTGEKKKGKPVMGYISRKSSTVSAEGVRLIMDGVLENGLKYGTRVLVRSAQGKVSAKAGVLVFSDVRKLEILVVAETNYKMDYSSKWRGGPIKPILDKRLRAASHKRYERLKADHIADYKSYYDRIKIDLGTTPAKVAGLPTDQRLQLFKRQFGKNKKKEKNRSAATAPKGAVDVDLQELIANYGRYLIISSSRPGCLPANLQGIWNWSNHPAWQSDYHSNINVQMNYWLTEPNGLGDCHTAFLDFIVGMREVYIEKTRKLVTHPDGSAVKRGWTLRTGTNPYGGDTFKWNHPAAAWYAQHMWEHYAFGEDREFLRKTAYPIFKETVQFWEDRLQKRPDGTLVVPDGWSPEHGPTEPGVSYDQEVVYDIFTNFIEASIILGLDADYRKKVMDMRAHLLKPKIGSWGQLQEWETDRDKKDDHHRHASHLFALHPGRQISPLTTPKLADAAAVSLDGRGDGGTGWSKAWKISFWARLHDGNRAYKLLSEHIANNFFPNLFDFHPPFQIDGNFGNTAGVTEMLLQSHMRAEPVDGQELGNWIVHLLPALPDAWPQGSVHGLRARGGLTVDMEWFNGKLRKAVIHGNPGKHVAVYYGGKLTRKVIPATGVLGL